MFKRKTTIKFSEFMSGEYKTKEKAARKKKQKAVVRSLSAIAVPALTGGSVLPLSLAFAAAPAFACEQKAVEVAGGGVTEGVTHFVSKHTLEVIAHSLDPVVEILVAFAFPVASVIMAGACFLFMFNRADRGFEMIQRAGLGYVLIQMLPFFLNVLKEIGSAM
ncbi:hypothetical protein [Bacillus phage DZ1]|uniref:Uncharacterized protein n=1 Tax=Bacillus phage DZ1 TaxID=3075862 RepID=A0AA96EM08_9CAUD|nr:hypothetical protein [Bacillus phage DZ1]